MKRPPGSPWRAFLFPATAGYRRTRMRWRSLLPVLVVVATLLVAGLASGARSSKRLKDDERGEMLYDRHCIQCHGASAAGDGPATPALVVPVPDLREAVDPDNL